MSSKPWSEHDLQILKRRYPDSTAAHVAELLGCSVGRIYNKAAALGLKKSQEFMSSAKSGRTHGERGKSCRFPKGNVPWNKGKKGWTAGGRSERTRFKKGEMSGAAQHNYKPIGSTRITRDGTLERKVTDDPNIYPARRWVAVPRLIWEAQHGPIPKGHSIVFRPGMHTTVEEEITIDKLECLSRAELMKRNSYHTRYPKEVGLAIQARGALMRQINKRVKQEEPA